MQSRFRENSSSKAQQEASSTASAVVTQVVTQPLLRSSSSLRESFGISSGKSLLQQQQYDSVIALLVCILIIPTTLGGYVFTFGLYAKELKELLDLSQSELTTLSTAIFCAGALQWAPGAIIDLYGERFSILTGAQLGAFSMLLYWAIARGYVYVPAADWFLVPTLVCLTVTTYFSESLIYGAVMKLP